MSASPPIAIDAEIAPQGVLTRARPTGDVFAVGVLVMLALSVVQRLIGLFRGIGFCHFLSDIELGHWALANSFFVIGVPIAVLGLPGSFGKFTEYYRVRNRLGEYLLRVVCVSLVGLVATCGLILCFPSNFSWLILGEENPYYLIVWCVAALISVATFSFINELAGSLRQVRVVSLMQFTQSFTFAVIGVWMIAHHHTWTVLLPCFAIASLVGSLPGVWVIHTQHRDEFQFSRTHQPVFDTSGQVTVVQTVWSRILPYAATVWLMNFLGNMFEISDRYMLLHFSPGGQQVGQALVGQYHAGYILPNLLTSLALMLSGILLPYLSADWEAGRQDLIAAKLRQMLQATSIGFLVLAIGALAVAPWLYGFGFGGRYGLAERVLPIALIQATWVSLFFMSQTYMLCAERGKQLALLLIVGLCINLMLNALLIPRFGLLGAVIATSSANLLALLAVLWRISQRQGQLGYGTVILCLAPLSLLPGPAFGLVALLLIVSIAGRTSWLLSATDRAAIDAVVIPKLHRFRLGIRTLWP
ncbi:MAG: lipopolysaccharide biosynthesis protein [Pirellulaceae bacterium]